MRNPSVFPEPCRCTHDIQSMIDVLKKANSILKVKFFHKLTMNSILTQMNGSTEYYYRLRMPLFSFTIESPKWNTF